MKHTSYSSGLKTVATSALIAATVAFGTFHSKYARAEFDPNKVVVSQKSTHLILTFNVSIDAKIADAKRPEKTVIKLVSLNVTIPNDKINSLLKFKRNTDIAEEVSKIVAEELAKVTGLEVTEAGRLNIARIIVAENLDKILSRIRLYSLDSAAEKDGSTTPAVADKKDEKKILTKLKMKISFGDATETFLRSELGDSGRELFVKSIEQAKLLPKNDSVSNDVYRRVAFLYEKFSTGNFTAGVGGRLILANVSQEYKRLFPNPIQVKAPAVKHTVAIYYFTVDEKKKIEAEQLIKSYSILPLSFNMDKTTDIPDIVFDQKYTLVILIDGKPFSHDQKSEIKSALGADKKDKSDQKSPPGSDTSSM
ncbi:MAG: hypothetical protein AABX38_02870 [Candidatus Micrarchaeota archaeon]